MSETDLLLNESLKKSTSYVSLSMSGEITSGGGILQMGRSQSEAEDNFMDEIRTSGNPDISNLADRSQGNSKNFCYNV